MPEGFRSLTEILRSAQPETPSAVEEPAVEVQPDCNGEIEAALRDVRLFRAAVADAVESAAMELLDDIAADVLARELHLSGSNIRTIVNRALERFAAAQPVRVRVHPADAAAVHADIPVVEDASLLPGDAILEVCAGSIDARLGTRLACVLAKIAL